MQKKIAIEHANKSETETGLGNQALSVTGCFVFFRTFVGQESFIFSCLGQGTQTTRPTSRLKLHSIIKISQITTDVL